MIEEYKECFRTIGSWIGKFFYGLLVILPALIWITYCAANYIQEPPVLDAICLVILNILWALIPTWFTWGKQFGTKKEYCKEYFSTFGVCIFALVLMLACLYYIVLPASILITYLCINGPQPPMHWYYVFIIPITLLWFPFGKWSIDKFFKIFN